MPHCPESQLTRVHELGSDPTSCHTCAMQYDQNFDFVIILDNPKDLIPTLERIEREFRMAQNAENN